MVVALGLDGVWWYAVDSSGVADGGCGACARPQGGTCSDIASQIASLAVDVVTLLARCMHTVRSSGSHQSVSRISLMVRRRMDRRCSSSVVPVLTRAEYGTGRVIALLLFFSAGVLDGGGGVIPRPHHAVAQPEAADRYCSRNGGAAVQDRGVHADGHAHTVWSVANRQSLRRCTASVRLHSCILLFCVVVNRVSAANHKCTRYACVHSGASWHEQCCGNPTW